MRYLLSLLPISRREADHSAGRIDDVFASLSWAEMFKTTLITITAMVVIPTALLLMQVRGAWA